MRKGLFYLLALVLLCISGLTGCSLLNEKEEDTSKQTSAEEKPKQKETEEKSKDSSDGEEKNEVAKEVEKSEASKQSSSREENTSSTSKDSSEKAKTVSSQVDWGNAWTRDIQFNHALLEITQKSTDTFKFKINATYARDAAAVQQGAVNVGDVEGTAKVEGNVATQTMPDSDTGCQVKLVNHTSYVEVQTITDCSGAAGLNVSFDVNYKKGNIPEKEVPVEENQVKEDETSAEDTLDEGIDQVDEDSWMVEGPQESTDESSDNQVEENTESDTTSDEGNQAITMEEAQKIVEDYIKPDLNHFVEYSSETNGDYVFAYYLDGDERASLIDLYGANSKTKQVYKVQ